MIEVVRLVAAFFATVFFLIATFSKIRNSVDDLVPDLHRAGRWTAAGTFAAAVVFGCEVAAWAWPDL